MKDDKPVLGSGLGETDLHLFNEGTHARLYERLGAHLVAGATPGVRFAVWAPNAARVAVMGEFDDWRGERHVLAPIGGGIWEGFVQGLDAGARYKYRIRSRIADYQVDKADPFAFHQEVPPATGSVVSRVDGHAWQDDAWMASRGERHAPGAPISIYEVHLGSFARVAEQGDRMLTYRELAPRLADHLERLGFTHAELLPVMEHPFYGSWGYQVSGYFAATSRLGSPEDLMFLVDHLHQRGLGVILDWVPAHFPSDEHGLGFFDGTHLYEHADARQGFHPDWKTCVFNYGRHEVRSFLLSSARFWLDVYHVDGLRVDAVASMLYLDYSRKPGEWVPNEHGGRENLAAIGFLRGLNEMVRRDFPDARTYAEESTSWPMVSRPTEVGGLGFGFKWDLGWMHDTLEYLAHDPIHRKYHHDKLTFRSLYGFSESYVLPLSHDEVVHGKGSLLRKMPGDDWQKRANLRLLFAYMYAVPGKKLLFMGAELATWREWNHDAGLDWPLSDDPAHAGIGRLLAHLNRTYRDVPALHALDGSSEGFAWVDARDVDKSVLCFERRTADCADRVVCVFNFTPVPRHNHRLGVDGDGRWTELVNSDATEYGGSGHGNLGGVEATVVPAHGRPQSIVVTLPPLAAVYFRAAPAGVRGSGAEGEGETRGARR